MNWDYSKTVKELAYQINNYDSDKIILAISGDISNSGKKEEYSRAHDFINALSSLLNEKDRRIDKIISVPGNHDILYQQGEVRKRSVLRNMKDTEYFDNLPTEYLKFENYYEFAKIHSLPNSSEVFSSTDLPKVDFRCDKYSIRFYLFNNAVFTTFKDKDDSRGVISMPNTYLDSINNEPNTINILMMHFPISFLDEYSIEKLKEKLCSFSYILCGHIHRDEHIQILNNDYMCPVSVGSALNAVSTNPLGFSILLIDEDKEEIEKRTFKLIDGNFVYEGDPIVCPLRLKSGINYLQKNKKFNDNLQHSSCDSATLALKDFFVFPDLQIQGKSKKLKERIKNTQELVDYLQKNPILIINGYSQTGKTSLINQMFSELDCIGMPVKLNFSKMNNLDDFDAFLKGVIEKEYVDKYAWNVFLSKNIKERIALVDDAILDDDLIKYIEKLEQFFGQIIITNKQSKLSESNLENLACEKIIKEKASFLSLRPMFYQKRQELIKRRYEAMVSFARRQPNEAEFIRLSNQVQMILNKYIGNDSNYPYFINKVICSVFDEQINFSSNNQRLYSDIYEIYINQVIGGIFHKPHEAKVAINLLQLIARSIVANETFTISFTNLCSIVEEYLTKKKLKDRINQLDILSKLVDGKILINSCSNYAFASPDFLAYFVAKDISKNIDDNNIETFHTLIDQLIDSSYIAVHEKTLLFLVSMRGRSLASYILKKTNQFIDEYDDVEITNENFAINDKENKEIRPLTQKQRKYINEKRDSSESENYDKEENKYKQEVEVGKEKELSERVKNYCKGTGLLNIIASLIPDLKTEIDGDEQLEYIKVLYKLPQIVVRINIGPISDNLDEVAKFLKLKVKELGYNISLDTIKEYLINHCRANFLGCVDEAVMRAHTILTEDDLKQKELCDNDTKRLIRLMSMLYDEKPELSFEKVSKDYFKYFTKSPFARNCISLMVRNYVAFMLPDGEAINKKEFLKYFFQDEKVISTTITDGMITKNE